jgi:hypothetical protein
MTHFLPRIGLQQIEMALELLTPDSPRREEFERRLQRLRKKRT